jgi:hypothetical protein
VGNPKDFDSTFFWVDEVQDLRAPALEKIATEVSEAIDGLENLHVVAGDCL